METPGPFIAGSLIANFLGQALSNNLKPMRHMQHMQHARLRRGSPHFGGIRLHGWRMFELPRNFWNDTTRALPMHGDTDPTGMNNKFITIAVVRINRT